MVDGVCSNPAMVAAMPLFLRLLPQLEFQVTPGEVQRQAHLFQHLGAAGGGIMVAIAD
jgi:hypothetical protein